jgi:hypothetical protein
MKIIWPWISRKKQRSQWEAGFDLGYASCRADKCDEGMQHVAELSMMHMELHMIRLRAGELKHENDLLKWRLMERDPEFVRDLEPECMTVGPNLNIKEPHHGR